MLIKRAYPNPLSLNRRASTIPTSLFLVSMPNTQNLRFCKPSSNYHESYRKTRFRKPAGYRKRWLATVVYRSNMRPGDSHRPFVSKGRVRLELNRTRRHWLSIEQHLSRNLIPWRSFLRLLCTAANQKDAQHEITHEVPFLQIMFNATAFIEANQWEVHRRERPFADKH